jgi:hypothetical protein
MRRHPRRARVNPSSPRAWTTSDKNGMISNHENMVWQHDWRGNKIINLKLLVSADELDKPQRQLGTLILPPDPPPIMNARPEQYDIDEVPVSTRMTMDKRIRVIAYTPYPIERIVSVNGNLPRAPASPRTPAIFTLGSSQLGGPDVVG